MSASLAKSDNVHPKMMKTKQIRELTIAFLSVFVLITLKNAQDFDKVEQNPIIESKLNIGEFSPYLS